MGVLGSKGVMWARLLLGLSALFLVSACFREPDPDLRAPLTAEEQAELDKWPAYQHKSVKYSLRRGRELPSPPDSTELCKKIDCSSFPYGYFTYRWMGVDFYFPLEVSSINDMPMFNRQYPDELAHVTAYEDRDESGKVIRRLAGVDTEMGNKSINFDLVPFHLEYFNLLGERGPIIVSVQPGGTPGMYIDGFGPSRGPAHNRRYKTQVFGPGGFPHTGPVKTVPEMIDPFAVYDMGADYWGLRSEDPAHYFTGRFHYTKHEIILREPLWFGRRLSFRCINYCYASPGRAMEGDDENTLLASLRVNVMAIYEARLIETEGDQKELVFDDTEPPLMDLVLAARKVVECLTTHPDDRTVAGGCAHE